MRRILAVLVLISSPAQAVCPTGQASFAATIDGKFRLCPSEVDADGDPVGTGFYQKCDVTVAWTGNKTATVSIPTPVAGTPVVVSFPAAKGTGAVIGNCTNADGITGANATATVTFRRGNPSPPGLSQ